MLTLFPGSSILWENGGKVFNQLHFMQWNEIGLLELQPYGDISIIIPSQKINFEMEELWSKICIKTITPMKEEV